MTRIIDVRRATRIFIFSGLAALGLAGPAGAVTNVEEFMIYETAYLESCGSQYSEKICRCSMEQLEDRITFYEFAGAVYRTDGNVLLDPRWGASARRVVEACMGGSSATAEARN